MNRLARQRGSELLEFALVLPLLLLLVFGIAEFSLVLFDKAVVTNAAREGARLASSSTSCSTKTGTRLIPG